MASSVAEGARARAPFAPDLLAVDPFVPLDAQRTHLTNETPIGLDARRKQMGRDTRKTQMGQNTQNAQNDPNAPNAKMQPRINMHTAQNSHV